MPPRPNDPNLLVATETADDAGVYRIADRLALVQTVDFFPPIVDDPFQYGQIAAANALSDIYAMNGRPLTALNIAAFPDDQLDLEILGAILRGGAERVAAAGAVILGGHTVRDAEIKYGLSVTGLVDPEDLLTNAGARPGDLLVLTKPLGTGFVATANKREECPPEVLERTIAQMIALNSDALEAIRAVGGVHALTDVTGFGLIGHAAEVAEGSGLTIELDTHAFPRIVGSEPLVVDRYRTRASRTNRDHLEGRLEVDPSRDPLGLEYGFDAQTSGGLLAAVDPERASTLLDRLRAGGCPASAIVGRVMPREGGLAIRVR